MNKKNFFRRMRMPLPELEQYYRMRRAESLEKKVPLQGAQFRRVIHPLLLMCVCARRMISHQKLYVMHDRHTRTNQPVIYACTHIGWSDVEMIFSAIKSHAYLFWGDPRGLYRRMEGFLLDLNGAICCDTCSKSDRHVGKESCVRLLQQGESLLIYPEGAWNICENQPVMPLYTGTAEMAIRTGAEIVPVAIEEYDKPYYINIGQNISLAGYTIDQKGQATEELSDILCTLKWEIWEKHGKALRADIPDGYLRTFIAGYEEQTDNVYTLEDIQNTRYHPKVTAPKEAFAFMQRLNPSRENAFLFRR